MRRYRLAAGVGILLIALAACSSDKADPAKSLDTGRASGAKPTSSASSTSSSPSRSVGLPVVSTYATPDGAADPAGDGKAQCAGGTQIGFVGALSGNDPLLGKAMANGAQLAVAQHNAANPNCQVNLLRFDSEGSSDRAPGIVTQVASTLSVIGVVGLPFDDESRATGSIFEQAGLAHITPSAASPELTQLRWSTLFRAAPNDAVTAAATAKLITGKLGATKVCVVPDDSAAGIRVAKAVTDALGASDSTCGATVKDGQTDFADTAAKVAGASPDVVFYAGRTREGAALTKELKAKSSMATFVTDRNLDDADFVELAGGAAEGAVLVCACVPGSLNRTFAAAYAKEFSGDTPGPYALESYDAATVLLKAIDSGARDRSAVLNYVRGYDAQGYAQHYKWTSTGEPSKPVVSAYTVKNAKLAYAGVAR